MFVVQPRIYREAVRCLELVAPAVGGQADFSVSRTSVEIPFGGAVMIEDRKKSVTKVANGDVVVIEPAVAVSVHNRHCQVEVHELLYTHGEPSFQRLLRPGSKPKLVLTWRCNRDLDLKKLPYLYDIYIIDQHVR